MVLKVLSTNIIKFWDLIKFAVNQVEKIGTNNDVVYNKLLASLLSDKAQCIVVFDNVGEVKSLCIVEIRHCELSATQELYIRCLYAFKVASTDEWVRYFNYIVELARVEKCNKITFSTSNPRIKSIANKLGAIEVSVNMEVEV